MALILDSSALYASLDRRDGQHVVCRELIRDANETLVIPAPVLVEIDYLLRVRRHPEVMLSMFDSIIEGAFSVEELQPIDYLRVRELCDRYSDADIGFVDAAVMAIVERLNETKLATLDRRHFGLIRPRHVDSLRLLPE